MKKTKIVRYTEPEFINLIESIVKKVKKEQLTEGWFDKLRGKNKPTVETPPNIKPEGSKFEAYKLKTQYNVVKSDGSSRDAYSVLIRPNGDLILLPNLHNSLIDKKIKVPSIERALLFLTDKLTEKEDKNERSLDQYDDIIEGKIYNRKK